MDYTCLQPNQKVSETELIYDLNSLYDYFTHIPDTRSKYGKQYPLPLLLMWILLAKLAGQDKPSGITEWVRHRQSLWIDYRLTAKAKTASHMTYRRVLVDTPTMEALEDILTRYHAQQLQEGQRRSCSVWMGRLCGAPSQRGKVRGRTCWRSMCPRKAWSWRKLPWIAWKMRS